VPILSRSVRKGGCATVVQICTYVGGKSLFGYGGENQLLISQDFVEGGLVLFDYTLVGQDGFLVLHDGILVGQDPFLIFYDGRLVGQDGLLIG